MGGCRSGAIVGVHLDAEPFQHGRRKFSPGADDDRIVLQLEVSFNGLERHTAQADFTHCGFEDQADAPGPLPRLASNGGDRSFESLVASVSRDIRPRSVLDEWIRLGVVRINEADQVELQEQAFIPRHGEAEKLAYYGLNLGDHITAATDNVLEVGRPWFERSVHHQGLSEGEVEALREKAAALGMTLLQDLHQQASSPHCDEQVKDRRFTCGVYFYSAPEDGEASQ